MAAAPRYCYRHPDRETGLSCSECDRPICYECMTPAPVGLRCPEHSGKPQGIQKVTVAAERAVTGVGSRRGNLVTMILIGLNLGIYALELAIGGNVSGQGNWIYEHGVLVNTAAYPDGSPAGVANGEWWRLMSSAFLHYGPIHLATNMFSLYFAGSILEQAIGRWRFAVLYLVSGLAGSAGALFWSLHIQHHDTLTAGASGAVFGVLGGLLILERRGNLATGGQVLGLIVLNLVVTFAIPGISIGGHLGGLVAGMLVMLGFLRFPRRPEFAIGAAAVVAAAALIVAYS